MKIKFDNFLRLTAFVFLKIINFLLAIDLSVMTVLMVAQIILRVFVGRSLPWSDEVLRFLFIWLVFLGLPSSIYTNDLTRFDLLEQRISKRASKCLRIAINCVIIFVLTVLNMGSFTLIRRQFSQMATSVRMPMGIVYMVLPISATLSILFLLINIYFDCTGVPDLCSKGEIL